MSAVPWKPRRRKWRLGWLEGKEKETFESLRDKVGALDWDAEITGSGAWAPEYYTSVWIARFLRSAKFDEKKALRKITLDAAWRHERFAPWGWDRRAFIAAAREEPAAILLRDYWPGSDHGFDREGGESFSAREKETNSLPPPGL